MTSELRNWAGTYTYTAGGVVSARTVDDVRRAVLAGGRVRAVGTRHSFNDLADTTGTDVMPETERDRDPLQGQATEVFAEQRWAASASWPGCAT